MPYIQCKIGNGENTWLWFDHWLPMGPIHPTLGDRVIYDSALPRHAKVATIIIRPWSWPVPNSDDLITLKNSLPPPPWFLTLIMMIRCFGSSLLPTLSLPNELGMLVEDLSLLLVGTSSYGSRVTFLKRLLSYGSPLNLSWGRKTDFTILY